MLSRKFGKETTNYFSSEDYKLLLVLYVESEY